MHIVLIGQGQWTVYATCVDETTCPLLDFIADLDEKRGAKVLSDLKEYVPNSTPADWARTDFSWPLRGSNSVFEFRWPTKRGGTPRVFWFYDKGKVLVCSHGLMKKTADLDPKEVQIAESWKARYLDARARGQLVTVALEAFDPPDNEESKNG